MGAGLRHVLVVAAIILAQGCSRSSSHPADSADTWTHSDTDPFIEWDGADGAEAIDGYGLDADGGYPPSSGLQLVFYDIGQGDAILVRFPQGAAMLVDGGPNRAGERVIVPHFERIQLTYLDIMVVTHPDADHCGGLDDVVYAIEVGEVWENGQTRTTTTWTDFSDAVDERGVTRRVVHRGYQRTIDSCNVKVLHADEGWGDANTRSVVLSVSCEGVTVLLTGDATEQTQLELIAVYGSDLEAEILKVPHHGSTDRSEDFPNYVRPETAVISVSDNNSYGHPDQAVIDEWEAVGAEVYRTDQHGTVVVTATDGSITVQTDALD